MFIGSTHCVCGTLQVQQILKFLTAMLIMIFMMMLKLKVYNGDDVAMFMIKMQAQKSLADSEALLTRTPTFSSFATALLNQHLLTM